MSAIHKLCIHSRLLAGFLLIASMSTNSLANEPLHTPLSQKNPPALSDQRTERFFKIDQNSTRLPQTSERWECVEDAQTGLFWQKRDPTSALHGHDRYVWYQPQHTPSGQERASPELQGIDASCYGYRSDDPASYCNTHAFIQRVNQSNYCGYSDWRLPTVNEMLSLVDPILAGHAYQSAIDLRYFPFNNAFAYWTDTVNENDVVMTIINDDQVLSNSKRTDSILVRLVRGNFAR